MRKRVPVRSKYSEAGVDIDRTSRALEGIREMVQSTHSRNVLRAFGAFGAPLRIDTRKYREPILVMSMDGVGTKLRIAFATARHDTVGQDIVNHCVNDILVQGAVPLAFMDYFATGKVEPEVVRDVVKGLVRACRENGCALAGGETAEMPDFYREGEYDLAGCILGIVERKRFLDGRKIRDGDVILGLPSRGLHTNGYSLARKVILEQARLSTGDMLPGTSRSVADVLLDVHCSYLPHVRDLVTEGLVHGMVHITGGGFYDNVPRVLPDSLRAIVDARTWTPDPVFQFIEKRGEVSKEEMYRVFNMGIGFLLITARSRAARVLAHLVRSGIEGTLIGRIEKGTRGIDVILPGR
jgi:phosphoribosylformylglycinamidine cyclo-ligase